MGSDAIGHTDGGSELNNVQASSLNAFFGVPANTLQSLNGAGGTLTNGSGIYQDFTGAAGDTVTMFFDYVARDYIPFNDPAFGLLVSPSSFQAVALSSIYGGGIEVGTAGNSGWRAISVHPTRSWHSPHRFRGDERSRHGPRRRSLPR